MLDHDLAGVGLDIRGIGPSGRSCQEGIPITLKGHFELHDYGRKCVILDGTEDALACAEFNRVGRFNDGRMLELDVLGSTPWKYSFHRSAAWSQKFAQF